MDLVATVRKEGSRGGRGDFKWSDVQANQHRESYLGHSVMAPVGRWQRNRDLTWYAKGDSAADTSDGLTEAERAKRERAEEIARIKEAERAALGQALGFEINPDGPLGSGGGTGTGANAVAVAPRETDTKPDAPTSSRRTRRTSPGVDSPREHGSRSHRHRRSHRHERRRSRNESTSRSRERSRDRTQARGQHYHEDNYQDPRRRQERSPREMRSPREPRSPRDRRDGIRSPRVRHAERERARSPHEDRDRERRSHRARRARSRSPQSEARDGGAYRQRDEQGRYEGASHAERRDRRRDRSRERGGYSEDRHARRTRPAIHAARPRSRSPQLERAGESVRRDGRDGDGGPAERRTGRDEGMAGRGPAPDGRGDDRRHARDGDGSAPRDRSRSPRRDLRPVSVSWSQARDASFERRAPPVIIEGRREREREREREGEPSMPRRWS